MKPRTKYQKQVVTSNKGLRPIKGAQMQWAFRECLDHYAFQLKHGQTTCMDCGHTWTTDEDADKCVCPKCKAKLKVQRTKRQKAMSSTYFSVLTERKGLQLMRAYQMKAYYRKGQKADIYCWEVARYWMNEKGKVEVMARKRTMGIYMDTFCYDSDIELRKDNTTYQHIASFPVCPDMKVIPQIWRNGFDGAFHGIEPLTLFKAMLTDHRIETMMKQCRYGHVLVKPACADGTAMQCGRVGGCLLYLRSSRSNDFGDLFLCPYSSFCMLYTLLYTYLILYIVCVILYIVCVLSCLWVC